MAGRKRKFPSNYSIPDDVYVDFSETREEPVRQQPQADHGTGDPVPLVQQELPEEHGANGNGDGGFLLHDRDIDVELNPVHDHDHNHDEATSELQDDDDDDDDLQPDLPEPIPENRGEVRDDELNNDPPIQQDDIHNPENHEQQFLLENPDGEKSMFLLFYFFLF